MPELDGIAATRRCTEVDDIDTKVLILTTFDLDEYVFEAVRAGASGFLLKDAPPEDLVAAIRVIVGEATVKTHVSRVLMKLGVRDRVQAVVAAYGSGLVRPTG